MSSIIIVGYPDDFRLPKSFLYRVERNEIMVDKIVNSCIGNLKNSLIIL